MKQIIQKLDKQSFKQQVLQNNHITIDKDGGCNFVVAQINDENFGDITPKLKQQLEEEGKYNWWIGFLVSKVEQPYTVQLLPIYGDSKKYVTKWFTKTAEEAIEIDLKDRQMELLKRANSYLG